MEKLSGKDGGDNHNEKSGKHFTTISNLFHLMKAFSVANILRQSTINSFGLVYLQNDLEEPLLPGIF